MEGKKCFSGLNLSQPSSPSFLVTLSIANSLTAITTMVLNSVILLTIWKTASLHKPSFVLLANLALADFLVGAVSQPARVTRNVLLLNSFGYNSSSEITKEICASALVTRASAYWLGAVSLYILTLISIDRMLAIKLKTSYRNVLTTRRIGVALFSFWTGSGVLIQSIVFDFERNSSKFLPIVLMPAGTSVFLLIIVVCYSRAIQELRTLISQVSPIVRSNSHPDPSRNSTFDVKKYQKTLKTMLIIFSAIIICYTPYIISVISLGVSSLLFPGKTEYIYYSVIRFCDFILWSSSSVNPLLYLWRMRELRKAARRALGSMFRRHLTNHNNTKRNKSDQRKVNIVIVKERGVNLQLKTSKHHPSKHIVAKDDELDKVKEKENVES